MGTMRLVTKRTPMSTGMAGQATTTSRARAHTTGAKSMSGFLPKASESWPNVPDRQSSAAEAAEVSLPRVAAAAMLLAAPVCRISAAGSACEMTPKQELCRKAVVRSSGCEGSCGDPWADTDIRGCGRTRDAGRRCAWASCTPSSKVSTNVPTCISRGGRA
eukprot:scaffold6575_cov120-Isochrysis_galbana.AAC.3